MGYTPQSRIYNVQYEDFPGLVIKCKGATIGELRLVNSGADTGTALGFFASKVISWNIQHPAVDGEKPECAVCELIEGTPLEPTAEAMQCLELEFCVALMMGWIRAITKVSPPKDLNFNNGGTDTQGDELMRKLAALQNPGTLPTPKLDLV